MNTPTGAQMPVMSNVKARKESIQNVSPVNMERPHGKVSQERGAAPSNTPDFQFVNQLKDMLLVQQ